MIAIFPEICACVKSGNIENLSILVRQYFGGEKSTHARLDIDSLLENFGLPFYELKTNYRGVLLVEDKKGTFTVSLQIDPFINNFERSFLLGHLLGHYLFEVQKQLAEGECKTKGFAEDISPLIRYEQAYYPNIDDDLFLQKEKLADSFSAALHLPKAMFLKAYESFNDVDRVAQFFSVSKPCVEKRYKLLTEDEKVYCPPVNEDKIKKQKKDAKVRPAKPAEGKKNGGGLDRIRELAKQLDDSVIV